MKVDTWMVVIMTESLDLSANTVIQLSNEGFLANMARSCKHDLMRFGQPFTRRGLSDLLFVRRKLIRGELVAVLYTKTLESDGDLMI